MDQQAVQRHRRDRVAERVERHPVMCGREQQLLGQNAALCLHPPLAALVGRESALGDSGVDDRAHPGHVVAREAAQAKQVAFPGQNNWRFADN